MSDSPDKRRRIRKPGGVLALKKKVYQALLTCEDILLMDDSTIEQRIRASNAIGQIANSYRRVIETEELEKRIEKLENSNQMRKVSCVTNH